MAHQMAEGWRQSGGACQALGYVLRARRNRFGQRHNIVPIKRLGGVGKGRWVATEQIGGCRRAGGGC